MSFTGMLTLIAALNHPPATPAPLADADFRELFPGVWADLGAKVVEFDGRITPMLVRDDRAPLFFLEVLACSPNTREHETFVVTTVKPSQLHTALLAIGLTPGAPGHWTFADNKLVPHQPTGDRLSVKIIYAGKDGATVEADPLDWIVNARTHQLFLDSEKKIAADHAGPSPGWIFAGSKFVKRKGPDGQEREVYDADGSGTVVGLTTFGSEVIAWSRIISPDASVEEPAWIADFSKTAPADTKVRVRVERANDPPHE